MTEQVFQIGQKVMTPRGEGVIVEIKGVKIRVHFSSGGEATFTRDKISDDSDAG